MSLQDEDCNEIVRRLTNNNGALIDFKLEVIGDGTKPIGFLGNHFNLNINYKLKNQKHCINYFVKSVPVNNANFKEYVLNTHVFFKEGAVYNRLMNALQQYCKQQFAARCILVKDDELIVLEDLYSKGYRLCVGDLNIQHGCAIIQSLARLHATSIVYEELNKKSLYDNHADMFRENVFSADCNNLRYKMVQNAIGSINDTMDLLQVPFDSGIKTKLIKYVDDGIFKHLQPSSKYRNVISHADLWKNNIMFRSDDKSVIDCVLIDFQFVRYAPPALDFLNTLYLNFKSDFIQLHKPALIYVYYKTFSDILAANNIQAETILSFDEFKTSMIEYELPALVSATLIATIIFLSDELSNSMVNNEEIFHDYTYVNRSKYLVKEFNDNVNFRNRFGDVLEQLIHCLSK